jgi:hypothetical protein
VAAGLEQADVAHLSDIESYASVTDKRVQELNSLTGLTSLSLWCTNVASEGLRAVSRLTALSTLYVFSCPNITASAKLALRTAIPNLTIHGKDTDSPITFSCCHPAAQHMPRSATVYSASRGGPPSLAV